MRERISGRGAQHCSCQCHWDLSWLHFGTTNIAPGDVDGLFVVERNRRFLFMETKGRTEELLPGQKIMLEQLSSVPGFTVLLVRGPKGHPEQVSQCRNGDWMEAQDSDRALFQSRVDSWFAAANGGAPQISPIYDAEIPTGYCVNCQRVVFAPNRGVCAACCSRGRSRT
jgi:hypothetical protein